MLSPGQWDADPEPPAELSEAFTRNGVDLETIARPDRTVYVYPDIAGPTKYDKWVAIGGEPYQQDTTKTWWTAADENGDRVYEGTDLDELTRQVGHWLA